MARDRDRIRRALGERTVSYYGISWGTYVGSTYRALFPQTIDRMVIDSSWTRTSAATPASGSSAARWRTGAGHRERGGHGVLIHPRPNACAIGALESYLTGGSLPATDQTCE